MASKLISKASMLCIQLVGMQRLPRSCAQSHKLRLTLQVPADAVAHGDIIQILPGDRVPVDGTVVTGRTTVNEAALTGEPLPVTKEEGSAVTAGTLNLDGMSHASALAM